MKLLQVQPFSQRDPKWRDIPLGFSTVTIGGYGCVGTAVSMVLNYWGKKTNPQILNETMKSFNGYFNSNLFRWDYVTKFYPDVLYKGNLNYETIPADVGLIRNYIDKNFPVVIKVEADEIGTPKGDHFMTVVGYTDDGDLWVIDPWDENPHAFRLGERYSHNGSHKPEHIILGIRPYEFTGQIPSDEDETPVTNKAQAVSEAFKGLTNANINNDELNKYLNKSLEWMVNDIIVNDKRFYEYRVKPLLNDRDKQWTTHLNNKLEEQRKECQTAMEIKDQQWKQEVEKARSGYIKGSGDRWKILIEALINLVTRKKDATV